MPPISPLLLNLNAWRCSTATAVIMLGIFDSPLWWLAAIPWLLLNLPGLLLAAIPALLLLTLPAGSTQADWMSESLLITLCVALPTTVSMVLSRCWQPLLRRTGIFDQFHYPEA
ncbi:MAG: hypothetical protein MK194_15025 [Roseibacillus sp.]|nr:hypothetical protein [Roseibacillus sp.]